MKQFTVSLVALALMLSGCVISPTTSPAPSADNPLVAGTTDRQPTAAAQGPEGPGLTTEQARGTAIARSRTREAEAVIRQTQTGPIPTGTPTKTPRRKPTSTASLPPKPTVTITPIVAPTLSPSNLALSELNAGGEMKQLLRLGKGTVNDHAWSPDGSYLAVATGRGIYLYDAESLAELRLIDLGIPIEELAFSPDGQALAVGMRAGVYTVNVSTGAVMNAMDEDFDGEIYALAFGRSGMVAAYARRFAGGSDISPELYLWEASTGEIIFHESYDLASLLIPLSFSPDGATLVYPSDRADGLTMLDVDTLTRQKVAASEPEYVAFSSDGNQMFILGTNISHINLLSGQQSTYRNREKCDFFASNQNALLCYTNSSATLLDPTNGSAINTFPIKEGYWNSISINPSATRIAYKGGGEVIVVDLSSGETVALLTYGGEDPTFATGMMEQNGKQQYTVAVGFWEDKVHLWNLVTGEVVSIIQVETYPIGEIAFSPDQNSLFVQGENNTIQVINLETGLETNRYKIGFEWNSPLVVRPDGKRLALLEENRDYIYELDLQTGQLQSLPANPSWEGSYPALTVPFFYQDNQHLYSWELNEPMTVLTINDLTNSSTLALPIEIPVEEWNFGRPNISAMAISSDGKWLAAGMDDGKLFIWDLQQKRLQGYTVAHEMVGGDGVIPTITSLQFNPASDLLLSAGVDDTVKLWNVRTMNAIRILNVCCRAAFSPDGRLLVTYENGVIQAWGLPLWP